MGDDLVHSKHNTSITQWRHMDRQEKACWYIDMQTLLSRHQKKPSLACTYALPFSCLHAFCGLLLAVLVEDLGCLPFVLAPCQLVTPAGSYTGLQPHSLLPLCCLLCLPCCSAGLPWQEGGSHCGNFAIFLQLYLVKIQARSRLTPLRSSRAIKLPSCHTRCRRCRHCRGPENRRLGGPRVGARRASVGHGFAWAAHLAKIFCAGK